MPKGDKYILLTSYLRNCGKDQLELTFEQVAGVVGGLPPSAYKHPAYWSNGSGGSFSLGWLNAGFSASASIKRQLVTFSRDEAAKSLYARQSRENHCSLSIDIAIEKIRKYHKTTLDGKHTRYRSWEHCHNAFKTTCNPDMAEHLCLHLAWYLASWGMLRNSFLLNHDHLIHMPVIEIAISGKYNALFSNEFSPSLIPIVMNLSDDIEKAYEPHSATDTLITKIMLGVFGCAPAYDRYFKGAARKYRVCGGSWNEVSLTSLWRFYSEHQDAFERLRKELSRDGFSYPPMKLMDMCLWQIGFDEDL